MYLTQKHIIKKSHQLYKSYDELCLKSKNLYNAANYFVRNHFIITKHYPNYFEIQKFLQGSHETYKNLPAKVSQQTLKLLDQNWKSFFSSSKEYKIHPNKFLGRPKLPGYKNPEKGRQVVIYTSQAISKNLQLSGTNIFLPTKIKKDKIKQVRIVPGNQQYTLEIIYKKNRKKGKVKKENIVAIDLGLNNLATLTSNVASPVIFNGRPLKSINQFYNKRRAELQSKLPDGRKTSNQISRLTNKRNNKISDALHKTSRALVNFCLTKNVGTIVIGKNDLWKNEINLGKRTNQNFVQIPFSRLVEQISYKADLSGIKVIVREESYTSKCSLLDNEKICKHENYLGRRISRGLFQSSFGTKINADVNGSGNIFRKEFPRVKADGIEGLLVNPLRFTPYKNNFVVGNI